MSTPASGARWSEPRRWSAIETLSLVCALLLVHIPARGVAQPPLSEPTGYREAVAEGLAEFEERNYPEARRFFVLAHQMFPNARTLRGLAVVSFELRRYGDTVRFCEQALASTVKPLDGPMRSEIAGVLARARELVAQITITLAPSTALVAIDGAVAKPLPPEPLLLDVGPHQLGFEATGFLSQRRNMTVEGGEVESWNISLDQVPSAAAADIERPVERAVHRHPSRLRLWVGGAAMGLGAAAFVAAGVFTAKRQREGEHLRAVEPIEESYAPQTAQWQNTRPQPYIFGTLGTVALAGGAVGLLLGIERRSFPWWASALTGAVGLGLAGWGIADVVGGTSCPTTSTLQSYCSAGLEERDRGALLLMSAAPLLSVPLTQLIRRAFAPSDATAKTLAIGSHARPHLGMVLFDARVAW